jgi:hypothetical protein
MQPSMQCSALVNMSVEPRLLLRRSMQSSAAWSDLTMI